MIGVWIRIGPSAKRLNALSEKSTGWRQLPLGGKTHEVTTNVYLALLNGHTLRLPAHLAKTRAGRIALWVTETVTENLRKQYRTQACRWKEQWQDCLDGFFRHPGAMRMRSSVVRGIDREFICNAAIAAPVRLAGLEPLRAVRVQSAGYDLFRRAGARTAIPGAIPRQIVPGFFCSGAYGRHLFFCTAALLICRGKIIPLSPGLHQLRRGLQFPGR